MRHFINTFSKLNKKGVIGCEVGVYEGDHASSMFEGIDFKELHLVDNYKDIDAQLQVVANAIKQTQNHPTTFHFQSSVEASKKFPDEYFDFVYIDADHNYEPVKEDIKAWFPKVKKGGYLAGHDWAMGDVQRAVKEFLIGYHTIALKVDDDEHGHNEDWYFQK